MMCVTRLTGRTNGVRRGLSLVGAAAFVSFENGSRVRALAMERSR
jgi:hypothetical protein